METTAPCVHRTRLRRTAFLSATILATGIAAPADAALFGVVVNQVPDPMLAGLSIPASAPTQGMWSGVYNWPMNAIALGLLPNGKVVSYGTPVNNPGTQDGRTFDIWDPTQGLNAGGAHTTLQGVVGINSFCSSQAFRLDGTMMSAGGIFDNGNDKGSVVLNSSATAITANAAKLANDRYYSTMLTLPNGQQLIMGGDFPYAIGWSNPQDSINQGYNSGMTPELYDGTKWNTLFGANSRDAFGPDNSRYWFPRAWVAPNGKVFGISSDEMWYLDPTGNGSVSAMPFKAPPQTASSATTAPNTGPASTAVMYDTGKILQVGGNSMTNGDGGLNIASSLATTIDINGATPVLAETAPMKYGRAWGQSTVLPTGQVAVTGGSLFSDTAGNNAVLQAEIWSPSSGQWTAVASAAIYRGYHSTAILMPNGTLLSAGGGAPGPVNNQNAEIYYPPYLFASTGGNATLAPRPSIVSLSGLQLPYAQSLQFELTSQNGLSQVVLIGTSLVTHSFNSTQRRYSANFSTSGNTVTVQAPASGNVAPPGYYQLVAIDRNGIPSPGIIIALGANVTAPTQAIAFVNAAQAGTGAASGTAGGTGTSGGTTTGSGGTSAGGAGAAGAAASGTGTAGSTAGANPVGTPISLQANNYPTNYLINANGAVRLAVPGSASDKQQSTFRLVPGLAGKGVSFASSTTAGQYLRHQNFQGFVQMNDGSAPFYNDATFMPSTALAGTCGCNSGMCVSYQAVNYPGYYLRHQNFSLYLGRADGSGQFNQDASFCVAPPQDGSTVSLQANNYPTNYLINANGAVRLAVPGSASDKQQSTFRLVPGLAGKGVSLASSTTAGQYLRHQNFQGFVQMNDGSAPFYNDATFMPSTALAGTCGCNSGMCVSYQAVNYPGYYLRHQNFSLYLGRADGSGLFNQDASFCVAPGLQ